MKNSNDNLLKILDLNNISISKTNPRKNIDESALKELTESIKLKGVLQPILVRPKGEKYELVCGERRFRASKGAELKKIPANIRELTDDEAFELQIIENLERKDVHPLDEADAFKIMLDSGKYTLEDIAAKMSKADTFILGRLKLVDLIEPIRKDFKKGYLGIGQATLIAKCSIKLQTELHDNASPYNDDEAPDYGTYNNTKNSIERDYYDLNEALFNKEDENLVKGCVSCLNCTNHSCGNPKLFTEFQENDICFDSGCFDKKTLAFIHQTVEDIINNNHKTLLVKGSHEPDEFISKLCKEHKVKLYKQYSDCYSYESTYNGFTEKRKAFIVSGYDVGKSTYVYIKPNATKNNTSKISADDLILEQIEGIKTRAKRSLELDAEKVWAKIRAHDIEKLTRNTDELSNNELIALTVALGNNAWTIKSDIPYLDELTIEKVLEEAISPQIVNHAIRSFLNAKLTESYGSHKTEPGHAAYKQVLEEYYPKEIASIENEQKEIADKRIARSNERISGLRKKLKSKKEEKKNKWEKVPKRYALNNSYFKNRLNTAPDTILEIAEYLSEHNELPFDYDHTEGNWVYDAYVEKQKRSKIYHSQFFTPPNTANRMAEIALTYYDEEDANVLDACCGFGMLSKALESTDFIIQGFDFSNDLVSLYKTFTGNIAVEEASIDNYKVHLPYQLIIANPPYEIPTLTNFFIKMNDEWLLEGGKAILLLPNGFIDKGRPKKLTAALSKFNVISREDMQEEFARTKIKAEIVVLEKK